jgi:hypothetical protein
MDKIYKVYYRVNGSIVNTTICAYNLGRLHEICMYRYKQLPLKTICVFNGLQGEMSNYNN